ncbi:MAG: hypothetical protein LQ337_003932 [Flavoplaca oasis]|nr:MAG: hypothetical protein LQ337_003932 [Flavoplaca oasis]
MEPQLADERQPLLRNTVQDLQSSNTALGEAHNTKQQDSNNGSDPKELSNGQLAVILDSTIVATILTPISSSFSSLSDLSWLASAYFIANAASQPIAGRFTDVFGRRSGLIISNVVFGFGTLLCGLANSEWVMILGRVVAGLGGGGIFAISTIVGSDLVPLLKRGIFQGLSNIPVGLGTGLGGLFGGWMNDHWGWKWAFLIQVPFIAVAALLVVLFVRVPVDKGTKPALKRIDYLGTILLIGAVVLLLLGLNSGSKDLAWTHWFVITSLCLSISLFMTFIYVEERVASEPIIPVKLLLKRTVAASCFTYLFTLGANFAILFYVPIYLQVTGLTTTEAGLRFVPQSACAALGSVLTGIAIRSTGEYIYFNLFIQAITVLGYALLATLRLGTHQWAPFLYLCLTGLGYGGMLVVALISLISSVDRKDQAVVTSASFAFRSIGSILGICIASTIFEHVLRQQLGDRLRHTQEADQIISRLRDNFDEVQSLPPELRQDVFDCYGVALKAVFATTLAMTICGTISSLSIKQNILPFTLARK